MLHRLLKTMRREVDIIFSVHKARRVFKRGTWVAFYKSGESLEAGVWLSDGRNNRKAGEWQGVGEGLVAEDVAKEVAEPWPVKFTGFIQNIELESTSRAHFCFLDFVFSKIGFPGRPFPWLWLKNQPERRTSSLWQQLEWAQ